MLFRSYVFLNSNEMGDGMRGGNNGNAISSILSWVRQNGKQVDYGGSGMLYEVSF